MDEITNAYAAPFSATAAANTTPAKIAFAYALTGLMLGLFLK